LSKLRQLAANLGFYVVGEKRTPFIVRQADLRPALGETGYAAFALAGNTVAVRRIEIGKPDFALPARLYRADLDRRNGLELVVRNPVKLLAPRNAALEHFRIIELGPYHLPAGGQLDLPVHCHCHRSSPSFLVIGIERSHATRKALSSSL